MEGFVVMQVQQGRGEGNLVVGKKLVFQTISDGGLLRAEGMLEGSGVDHAAFGLKFIPGGQIKTINRRQSFRVSVGIKGKMAGTTMVTTEEHFDSEWECAIRDLSVGGAKLVLASPGPSSRSKAMITFQLPTEDRPLVLRCVVVGVNEGANPKPMDTVVRLAFLGLTSAMENQLSRFINWYQLEMRRKGIQ